MQTLPESIRKFRLGIYSGQADQPLSLMREIGPFAAMAKEDPRLELVFPPPDAGGNQRLSWDWLVRCDAAFYSHPGSDYHVNSIALATMLGIPAWVEIVDNALAVRATNPSFHQIHKKALQENIQAALDMASVVTVISDAARDTFLKQFKEIKPEKIVVLREACLWPARTDPRQKVVTWRGLHSHFEDVLTVLPQWCEVARTLRDEGWTWVLFGTPPDDLTDALSQAAGDKNVKVSPFWPTPFHQFQAWGNQSPFLHLAPLADNEFNRGKSHLAWLEATAAGAATIVPAHLPEWQQPGVLPYTTGIITPDGPQAFEEVLHREMKKFDGGKFHAGVKEAREAVYPGRTLTARNQERWAILRRLLA